MIKATHHPLYVYFFKLYSTYMLKKHFNKLIIKGFPVIDSSRPLLLIANHFSWWDGFIISYLNDHFFGKKLHIMMLEEQLRTRKFLSKAGAYSIQRKSRHIIESLNYTSSLFNNSDHLIAMFPQGEIQTMHQSIFHFEKGIEKITQKNKNTFQFLMLSIIMDYFNAPKPSITLAFKEINLYQEQINAEKLSKLFESHMAQTRSEQHEKMLNQCPSFCNFI